MKNLSCIGMLLIGFSNAHAQTVSGPTNPLSPSIEAKRLQATNELKAVEAKIEEAAGSEGSASWICDMQILKLQRAYAEWFLGNVSKFDEGARALNQVMQTVQVKIDALNTESITPVAVEGQKTSDVQIGFKELAAYLRVLNSRYKNCSKEQLPLLMAEQEDPRSNSILLADGRRIHVGHSQINAVIEKMTSNLNASLKSAPGQFSVNLVETDCGFELNLTAQVEFSNQGLKPIEVSLLSDPKTREAEFTKATAVYAAGQRVGKYSASGEVRYLEMYHEMVNPSCALPTWAARSPQEIQESSVPYYSFEQANALFGLKPGPKTSTSSSGSPQAELRKSFNIETAASSDCSSYSASYSIPLKSIQMNGRDVASGGCVHSLYLVKFETDVMMFGITYDRSLIAKTPNAQSWSELDRGEVVQIIWGGLVDGKPTVAVVKSDSKVMAYNMAGSVDIKKIRLPAADRGTTTLSPLEWKKTSDCNSYASSYHLELTSVYYNNADVASGGCVADAKAIRFYDGYVIYGIASDRNLVMKHLYARSWTTIYNSVSKIVSTQLVDGRPQVRFTNTAGQVFIADSDGRVTEVR